MKPMNNSIEKYKEIEDKLSERRAYWVSAISDMNECLTNVEDLTKLQSVIFMKRQEALENYHNLSSTLAKRIKKYKEDSAKIYKELRLMKTVQGASTFMFPTEGSIREQIEAQLSSDKYLIDIIENHVNYLDNTIKTIDGIVFAISNRIKIEEIKIGR